MTNNFPNECTCKCCQMHENIAATNQTLLNAVSDENTKLTFKIAELEKDVKDAEERGAKLMLEAWGSLPFDLSDSADDYRKLAWEVWRKKREGK